MNRGFKVSGFLFVICTVFAFACEVALASVEQKAQAFVLCKRDKAVRSIRILPDTKQDKNCVISYSKDGEEEIVGSHSSMSSCQTILKNIQANLEIQKKWSCKTFSRAQVTTSSEVIRQ
jgi:hypothetical protein